MLIRTLSLLLLLGWGTILAAAESDTLTLSDGRTLQGIILAQQDDGVDFLEIVQPAGKPTFGVVRNYPKNEIRAIAKADEAARPQLIQRVERLRNRLQIEAENRETIQIKPVKQDGVDYRIVSAEGYDFYSRLDESLTRRLAVRMDQASQAFQHMIPPRRDSDVRLRIIVFDDMREYADYTATFGATVRNPAIFLPQERLILVGTDFRRLQSQAKQAAQEHQRQTAWWETLRRELPARLDAYRKELAAAKIKPEEIEQEVSVRREAFQRQRQEALTRIRAVERTNADALEKAIEDTTRQIYHEAFHAYLECFVFPVADYDVPIWLNEGLAQLFEHGQLEEDSFRIDAPPSDLVAELKQRLASTDRPLLAELLERDSAAFVLTMSPHREQLDYALAWGLAWRLVFEERLFEGNRLEQMVTGGTSRRQRLENLLGKSLDQFEPQWREYVENLPDR
ncbi:DUF1570 domain-containing protein [Blastopirellula sp. JC732]|uniref:DUF1570 domain-containing protein n=1 Tax=Blastopirellula sediminis TaxID=2894196 RepID=A0A9X1SH67_9BACT|nr:DUF1570 domain-containing protein [Blastopirellula sediminis]MCC9605820.1 DUF1570 domain-containing protein [Blastopirellula sediminis]MCC9630880.1 DUF1570 domain-containing protein [Blastopirellula sediminis]